MNKYENLAKLESEREIYSVVEKNWTSRQERQIKIALENIMIGSAEMVFATLSTTAKPTFQGLNRGFEFVLIDEAAQAFEVAALQPFLNKCESCVLVGDPQQLPATIISQKGKELNMGRSLFARLQEAGAPVKILNTQYRLFIIFNN